MHLRSPFLLLLWKSFVIHFCTPNINRKLPKRKRVRQEEEEEEAKQAAERTGEDLCHPSGYNNETARAVSLIIINVVLGLIN